MADPLVETKLLPPAAAPRRRGAPSPGRPAGPRRRSRPVTLVSAPAGFGKTTLLASWFARHVHRAADDHGVAWVSLDERDRAPRRSGPTCSLALDRAVPGSGAAALTLLQSGQAPVETVLAGVVNELSVHPGEVTVVLDDYHLADGVDVATGMTFLVDHLPPQLRLVISTRADPALPLSRLRARGELVEIRAADLRFTGEEVSGYLNDAQRLDLTAADLAALEARTEGWVAALQLAALSLRDRDDPSRLHRRVRRRRPVRRRLPRRRGAQPAARRRTPLPARHLDPRSADRVALRRGQPARRRQERQGRCSRPWTGRTCSSSRSTTTGSWYRYHHLFGDVLQAHLLEERPGDVSDLHRRAAGWYADAGPDSPPRSATPWPAGTSSTPPNSSSWRSRRCVANDARTSSGAGLDELPDAVVTDRPVLAIELIGGLMASNEFDGVDQRLQHVEELMERPAADLVVMDHDELARVPASVQMYRAALALIGGDPAGAITRAEQAIRRRPTVTTWSPAPRRRCPAWRPGPPGTSPPLTPATPPPCRPHPGRAHRGRAGLLDRDGRHGAEAGPATRRRAHPRARPRARGERHRRRERPSCGARPTCSSA